MENSSKALLIAAAVLITILIVTISIKVLSPADGIVEDAEKIGLTISSSSKDEIGKLQAALGIDKENEKTEQELEENNNNKNNNNENNTVDKWDEATNEDYFIWKSDDPTSPNYGVVIGYTQSAYGCTILRYPRRTTQIIFENRFKDLDVTTVRSFTKTIKKIEIPNTVKTMELCAGFDNVTFSAVEEVVFENGITTVDGLSGLKSLKKVTIPDSVTSIGNNAFQECSKLSSITIPNSVTSIGYSAFWKCTSLEGVTIPDSVMSIGGSAFYGCWKLSSVTMPDSVTSIGDFAFDDCWKLSSITIPDGVTSIGTHTFENCTSLETVTIPNSVISIGEGAFYNCTSLEKVKIMSTTLSNVEKLAFINLASGSKIYVLNEEVGIALNGKYTTSKTRVKLVTPEQMGNL